MVDAASNLYTRIQSGTAQLTLPTGIPHWDAALLGGMWTGLNYLAGSQGMGKSTLMNSLCGLWTGAGYRGFIAPVFILLIRRRSQRDEHVCPRLQLETRNALRIEINNDLLEQTAYQSLFIFVAAAEPHLPRMCYGFLTQR